MCLDLVCVCVCACVCVCVCVCVYVWVGGWVGVGESILQCLKNKIKIITDQSNKYLERV